MNDQTIGAEMMTAQGVANMLLVSNLVQMLASDGNLKGSRVGRLWRLKRESVDAFLMAR